MKIWQALSLNLVLSASAFGSVTAYFNHNQSNSYTEPYRKITRQGDNLEAVILDQIATAKKSIYLAVQELRLPLVADALIQKKKAGVDVRIVIEHDYNHDVTDQRDEGTTNEHDASRLSDLYAFVDMNRNGRFERSELESRDAIYMLRKGNMPLLDDTSDGSSGSGLMHHKFMIVDGKTTIVSSANFTMSGVHGDVLAPESRGNANSMIVVKSVAFAKIFNEEFSQLWGNGRRGNYGHNKTYRGRQSVTVRGIKLTVQFSPTSQRYNWEESTNGLIASQLAKARQSINAALFVFSDQKISDVMEKSQAQGARIGVVIEPKFAYRDYSELLDMLGLEMQNAKCSLEPDNHPWKVPARDVGMGNLPDGDVLHHKFAVVDNQIVVMGSENWSDAANYTNDETLLVVEDSGISDLYTQEFQRIKRSATLGKTRALTNMIDRQERACADHGFYK